MASFKDVKYIRSSVNFTHISSVGDIRNKGEVNVKWNLVLKHPEDLMELRLLRAVLYKHEKADLGSQEVLNKFRTVYSWQREVDGGEPAKEFTDVFKWDDDSDNNLHNLNITNDANWNQSKFKAVLRQLASGEQGILYKIYGYSRRMNRAATPIGFFCDGSNIVALSERNQIINDKWYNECGQVWKAGASVVGSGEKFVRVAVDMNRDLGEKPKKCRRVWATTNKGRVVLFDYWTGTIIWHKIVSNNIPLYAMAYDANNNLFVYYDGFCNIVSMKEDVNTGSVVVVKTAGPFGDFQSGAAFAEKEMGAVCVAEREDSGAVFSGSYFYVIVNRETVLKFKITATNITKVKTIPRTHFGCTAKWGDIKTSVLGETPKNQNNVYGIGAGVNGQIWVNGHTPITIMSHDIKPSGNPINVKIRLGRGNWGYNSDGSANVHEHRGCNYINTNRSAVTNVGGQDYASDGGGWLSHVNPETGSNEVYLTYNLTYKHWGGQGDETCVTNSWDYAASMLGDSRTWEYAQRANYNPGCAIGVNSPAGINFINYYIGKHNHTGAPIDQRVLGAGTAITIDSVSDLPAGGPENGPTEIARIHMELVSVEDGAIPYTDRSFLQDTNYVYGCVDNENYNDSNGRIEDLECPTATDSRPNYRRVISGAPTTSNVWFDSMTKWNKPYSNWDVVYSNQFGFAGKPFAFNKNATSESAKYDLNSDKIKTLDKNVGKPHTLDSREKLAEKARFKNVFNEGNYIDLSKYEEPLPMSIGSIYPRLPADGRLFVAKNKSAAYKASGEDNALAYEIFFADRREGKIGFLNYNRPASSMADISYPTTEGTRRVAYTDNTTQNVTTVDADREYYCAYTTASEATQQKFLHTAPYHVVVDSDNNPWFSTQEGIGKIQLLNNSNGRRDKYVYDVSAGSGLFAYENNNRLFESSLVLLEQHAKSGAYYSDEVIPDGIRNGTNGYNVDVYMSGQDMLDTGKFTLSSDASSNQAYIYNYEPWKKTSSSDNKRPWDINNVFNGDGSAVWKLAYIKSSNVINHADPYGGNLDNEFNSDNFGLNCLNQLNRVEIGPDIIHPKILKPAAKTKIIKAFSTSHTDLCDTFDSSGFWDEHTSIFNDAQTASGYDDLDTTHYIYDIETNYRNLIYHRYEYHDKTAVGANTEGYITRRHLFEKDENYDLINLENVIDNSPDIVWHTPNYVALIPPYGSLATLSANDPHAKNNQYWVDMYLDYAPSIYNLWLRSEDNQYEFIQVGHHDIHVFERWPTPDFCIRGIGNSESIDKITEYDLVGTYYWGDCVNDPKC